MSWGVAHYRVYQDLVAISVGVTRKYPLNPFGIAVPFRG